QKRRKQNTNDITSELLNTTTQENSKSCESTSAMIVEQNSRSGLTPKIPSMTSETTTEINNIQIRIDPIQQDREADKIGKYQSQSKSNGNQTTHDTETSRDPMTIRTEKEGITLEPTHTEQTLDMEIDETPTNIPSKEKSEQNIPQRLYSDAAKKAKSTESQQTHTRRNREEEMA
ncbi:hypothetical protein C2G38_2297772, partial [Gigaspora rosea]